MMNDFVTASERLNNFTQEKIITQYDSDRAFWNCDPWIAHFESYDGAPIDYGVPSDDPIAFGCTEQEAIENLLELSR